MLRFSEFLNKINHKLVEVNLINEMSTVCSKQDGYGFVLKLYSNDHEPAHMHMFDLNNKLITKILIDNDIKKFNDIKTMDKQPTIDNNLKKQLFKWAMLKDENGVSNWVQSKIIWKGYHKK